MITKKIVMYLCIIVLNHGYAEDIPHPVEDDWQYVETNKANSQLCLELTIQQKSMGTEIRRFYFTKHKYNVLSPYDYEIDGFPRHSYMYSIAEYGCGYQSESIENIINGNVYIHLTWRHTSDILEDKSYYINSILMVPFSKQGTNHCYDVTYSWSWNDINPNQKLPPTVKTPDEAGNEQGTAADL